MNARHVAGIAVGFCLSVVCAGCSGSGERPAQESAPEPPKPAVRRGAEVDLEGKSGSTMTGRATFTEREGQIAFHILVQGAPPGTHAVHIHEFGDCSDPEAKSAGAHWNPTSQAHGQWGHGSHLGDIGNLEVDDRGQGMLTLTTDLWSIGGGGASDVLGKSIIVHAAADDFTTQPTGNAGGRIGCGVIREKG
jgi:Cu-Zn family superoxide dismutase